MSDNKITDKDKWDDFQKGFRKATGKDDEDEEKKKDGVFGQAAKLLFGKLSASDTMGLKK